MFCKLSYASNYIQYLQYLSGTSSKFLFTPSCTGKKPAVGQQYELKVLQGHQYRPYSIVDINFSARYLFLCIMSVCHVCLSVITLISYLFKESCFYISALCEHPWCVYMCACALHVCTQVQAAQVARRGPAVDVLAVSLPPVQDS